MLPNLIVIGAVKAGTSSFHNFLDLHPSISMSSHKELAFFVKAPNRGSWSRGRTWYEAQWPAENTILGECSPQYTYFPLFTGVPERMHAAIPHTKLIYLVRDPIKRLVSHYLHNYRHRYETRSLEQALTDPSIEENSYVFRSRYFFQLSQYLRHFEESQILVLSSERLLAHPEQTMQRAFAFLGVDSSFSHPDFIKRHNQTKSKKQVTWLGYYLDKLRYDTGSNTAASHHWENIPGENSQATRKKSYANCFARGPAGPGFGRGRRKAPRVDGRYAAGVEFIKIDQSTTIVPIKFFRSDIFYSDK